MTNVDQTSKERAKKLFGSSEAESFEVGTTKGLRQIHTYLFGDLYDFAGKIRMKDISKGGKLNFTQTENDFIDFKREPLIPYKCSRKGPYFTKADVNGDGLEDLFIGGAAGFEKHPASGTQPDHDQPRRSTPG